MKSKVLKYFCLVFLMSVSLSGCIHLKKTGLDNWDRTVGLVQRTDVTDKKTKQMTENLMGKGVKITTLGQDYQLMIPTRMIFAHRSPKVNWGSYPLLQEIVAYLNLFRMENLYVEAYVDEDGSNTRNYALAKAQSRIVADYIAGKTRAARLVVARGYNQVVEKEKGHIVGGIEPSELVISFRNRIL